jgi:hypothetical protein
MPPESPHWIPTHLVALLLVWSITCLAIVAAFIYSLARLIIKKADVGDLPQILTALAPLILAIAHLLSRIPGAAPLNAINPARRQPAAAEADSEMTHEAGEWQA